jgi:DAACS family dicarboxylate/amino acid:cation (Na+ or H+) symporter
MKLIKMFSKSKVLIATLLAVLTGYFAPIDSLVFNTPLIDILNIGWTSFLNIVSLLTIPLIISGTIVTISKTLKNRIRFKKTTLVWHLIATNIAAIVVGLFCINFMQYGLDSFVFTSQSMEKSIFVKYINDPRTVFEIMIDIIPTSISEFLNEGLISVVIVSIIFGILISQLPSEKNKYLMGVIEAVYEVSMMAAYWVMKLLPFGIFFLVSFSLMANEFAIQIEYALLFFIAVILALFIYSMMLTPLIMKIFYGGSITEHFTNMIPALKTAFIYSSSTTALPDTAMSLEKNGVKRDFIKQILPMSTSLNISGVALYECMVVMFIAHISGVELSIVQQITVALLAIILSLGVSGAPSAGLIAILVILSTLNIPIDSLGMVMITFVILDKLRAVASVFSSSCIIMIVAKKEKVISFYNK